MQIINYFDLQKHYRISLDKMQVISDLAAKKFDFHQLHFITNYQIKCLIEEIKLVFEGKNDLRLFLDFYLATTHFTAINRLVSKSTLTIDTRSILELKEFLRLCNTMLMDCNKDLNLLRRFILVRKTAFDEWYKNELKSNFTYADADQINALIQLKKDKSRIVNIDCPHLFGVSDAEYYLVRIEN